MRYLSRIFVLAISAFTAQLALCSPLYTFTHVSNTFSDNPLTIGFTFTANSAFEVSSLGWFDATGTGFQSQHTVGIFDASGNLLSSTVLSAGAGDPLTGSFRYQSIGPVTLDAGSEYTLAGTTGGPLDTWAVNNQMTGFAVNPAFTIGSNAARFTYSSDFVYPTAHYSDYLVYAGPNLDGDPVTIATPEPGSLLLLPFAAAALICFRKLRPGVASLKSI